MKYIAKEDLNCEFGILKVGDSFEADPKDERVAMLMVSGKVVSAEAGDEPEPKKSRKNAKKAEKEEVVTTPVSEPEPEAEEVASDEE